MVGLPSTTASPVCLVFIIITISIIPFSLYLFNLHFLYEQKTKQKSRRRIFTSLIPCRSEAANPLTHSLWSLERNGFIDFILGIPSRRKAEAGEPPDMDLYWTIPTLSF
ncbi:MAG: hypothetical protein GX416_09805 [Bacteroidales bacterium]|nr:hypothetical protein [Bacteroidales bacterium]